MKNKLFSSVLIVALVINLSAKAGSIWLNNMEKAREAAASRSLPILIDFTGSDWCGWCIKLDQEVFSTEMFSSFAKDNLVLLKIDFPKGTPLPPEESAVNQMLIRQYGVHGFPTIILADAEGKELARTGYRRGGPEEYIKHLQEISIP